MLFLKKSDASLVHNGYSSDGCDALMSSSPFFLLIENRDDDDKNGNPVFMSLPAHPPPSVWCTDDGAPMSSPLAQLGDVRLICNRLRLV